jgi:DNA-binding NtrC family response regulator
VCQVNGAPLAAPTLLSSGDRLTLGKYVMRVFRGQRHDHAQRFDHLQDFRELIEREVGRTLRYARVLSVVSMRTQKEHRALLCREVARTLRRLDTMTVAGPCELYVLMPETDAESARAGGRRVLRALSERGIQAQVGVASVPVDGWDVGRLLDKCTSASVGVGARERPAPVDDARVLHAQGFEIIVADPAMNRVYGLLERLSGSALPVLLLGETGTGKELAAAMLHTWSPQRDKPFLTVNCAALHENLLESELFGHDRGAFTGATNAKPGIFEAASGGTVFLDEIGDLPLAAQAKLLRVLETKRVLRLGEVHERTVEFRVVAATHRNLEVEATAGRFRRDLLFRLNAAVIRLPPLRERMEELPVLARRLLEDACRRAGRPAMPLTDGAVNALTRYPWPGNVRELKNVLEFMAATVTEPELDATHLGTKLDLSLPSPPKQPAPERTALPERNLPLEEEVRRLERKRMADALVSAHGNQTQAAKLIGMPRRTFVSKLKKYNLSSGDH